MKNGKAITIRERLQKLEQEVEQLRSFVETRVETKDWRSIVGSHAGDPVFEEIVRLGQAFREAERRKARRRKRPVKQ